jgi:hypothetical protein
MTTVRLTLALCLTIFLSMALHTSLYAPIYDFRKDPAPGHYTKSEWDAAGKKYFTIENHTPHEVYIRIGYRACDFTGFQLKPKQSATIQKAPGCVPYLVSGNMTLNDGSVVDIQNPFNRGDILGTNVTWQVKGDKSSAHIILPGEDCVEKYELIENTDVYTLKAGDCVLGNRDLPKSFMIDNTTSRDVYVRISYGTSGCRATGFRMKPGQKARIFKAYGCVPQLISTDPARKSKGFVPYENDIPGHLKWDITDGSVEYGGAWKCDTTEKDRCFYDTGGGWNMVLK